MHPQPHPEPSRAHSARALEAAGAATVTFEFRSTAITIPLALEAWPLAAIRADKPGRAVRTLLGDQRAPLRTHGDIMELSHRMADACGVTPLPEAAVQPGAFFGALPTLLAVVDNHADDLEADLRRFFGVDYRPPPPAGPTLRQVWVYVRRLPPESAVMAASAGGDRPWSRTDILLARLWELQVRKRYPGRPLTKEEIEEWLAAQQTNAKTMDHLADREAYYASGQNMRDAGVDPGPRHQPPKQPPQQQRRASLDPVHAALAVARKNALRTPPQRGPTNGRPAAVPAGRGYNPEGSGWG